MFSNVGVIQNWDVVSRSKDCCRVLEWNIWKFLKGEMVSVMIFSTRENGEYNNIDVKEYTVGFVSLEDKRKSFNAISFDLTRFNHFIKFQFPSI